MPNRIHIRETHTFRHNRPPVGYANWSDFAAAISFYPQVDVETLLGDDANPFYLTLPIAEIGRTSANGLLYDPPLVESIETQLPGAGGLRGHVTETDLSSAYPVHQVFWVGHKRVGETTYAKGYIPPGPNRDDIRRVIANGGSIRTSIFGQAVRETLSKSSGTWRARDFVLETLDLAPPGRASLQTEGQAVITREMTETETENQTNGGGQMPTETTVTLNDVPQMVREQIIREAQVQADAARVGELESQIATQTTRISELESEANDTQTRLSELQGQVQIVAEIQGLLDDEADVLASVRELVSTRNALQTLLGADSDITTRVTELHTRVGQLERTTFEQAVTDVVAELTDWNVTEEAHKAKLEALRNTIRGRVLAELGQTTDSSRVQETAQTLWTNEFQLIAETMRDALAGPAAITTGTETDAAKTLADRYASEAGRKNLREKFGV